MYKNNCTVDAVISLALGVIIGLIYSTGIITGVITAIWIIFGIAILTLILSLLKRKSGCTNNKCIAISSIGAIVLSIIALSTTLGTTLLFSILIGILGFFAVFVLISLYRLIECEEKEYYKF